MIPSFSVVPVEYILICLTLYQNIVSATPIDLTRTANQSDAVRIVTREEWGARRPVAREPLELSPTPYVVIHHGGIAKYCHDQQACSAIVKSYQNLHMDDRGWFDIGYSFVIGEDGNVYEGRGWDSVGAHAPGYNTQSIGICVMGDFSDFLPNKPALNALNALIKYGVETGKICETYNLIGHRQARNTLCPGEEFYKYVQKLPRWIATPTPRPAMLITTEAATELNKNIVEISTETRNNV